MYDVEEETPAGDNILQCRATAWWDRGPDSEIRFYVEEEDEDGDHFIGYEPYR